MKEAIVLKFYICVHRKHTQQNLFCVLPGNDWKNCKLHEIIMYCTRDVTAEDGKINLKSDCVKYTIHEVK